MTHTVETFWKKVRKGRDDECWNWRGYQNKPGSGRPSEKLIYGRIDIFGHQGVYAHRVAYFVSYPGRIRLSKEDGRLVLHKCDNPLCCNPRHLFLGTHNDNMRDMVGKGRAASYTSTGSPRAKLTAEDVFWIRMQKKYGATCKALAMLYEVSESTIHGCLYGRHYQDVS